MASNQNKNEAREEESGKCVDIAVIGAGLQGASVALAAVARGLSTLLIHAGPVGGSASSRQSVLVGGGFEELTRLHLDDFLCSTRELSVIRRRVPHLASPLSAHFLDAGGLGTRARIGLARRVYQQFWPTDKIQAWGPHENAEEALINSGAEAQDPFFGAFGSFGLSGKSLQAFTLNYARLGIATLQQLEKENVSLLLGHRLIAAERGRKAWDLQIKNLADDSQCTKSAKIVVNCAGARIDSLIHEAFEIRTRGSASCAYTAQIFIRLPQSWRCAAILPGVSDRLLTVHPVSEQHVCLGPIYLNTHDENAKVEIIEKSLAQLNRYLKQPVSREDIAHCEWTEQAFIEDPLSGRPCEDVLLDLNNPGEAAPLVNIFGSKPCQHRKIAQQALDVIADLSAQKPLKDTREIILPGGDFAHESCHAYAKNLALRFPYLRFGLIERYVKQFGSASSKVLKGVNCLEDMGKHFGHGLFAVEVNYMREYEWAASVDDILWRRTLLGLLFSKEEVASLQAYLAQQ